MSLSRPGKVLFPASDEPAVTKADLATYYSKVAPVMLPHVRHRPISMERCPDGIEQGSFYEKKVPGHFPDFVATVEVETADRCQHQAMIEDARTLVYLADQACITPLTWLSIEGDLRSPDQVVFDLDPPAPGLRPLRRATRLVADLLWPRWQRRSAARNWRGWRPMLTRSVPCPGAWGRSGIPGRNSARGARSCPERGNA